LDKKSGRILLFFRGYVSKNIFKLQICRGLNQSYILAYISGLNNRGEKPISALDSTDFRDTFSFFNLFSKTIFKQVMSIRVLVVKNSAKRKNSDFSFFAFRNSISVFKYAPNANKEC
jgi:hypothetical protein